MEQAMDSNGLPVSHSLPLSYFKQFLQCQKDMEAYVGMERVRQLSLFELKSSSLTRG
jgi:hypothetical protein